MGRMQSLAVAVMLLAGVCLGAEVPKFEDKEIQEQIRVCMASIEQRYQLAESFLSKSIGKEIEVQTASGDKTGELVQVHGKIVLSVKLVINRKVMGSSSVVIEWKDVTVSQLAQWTSKWKPAPGAAALHAYLLGAYGLVEELAGRDALSQALVDLVVDIQAKSRVEKILQLRSARAIVTAIENFRPAYGATPTGRAYKGKLDGMYTRAKESLKAEKNDRVRSLMKRARHVSRGSWVELNPDSHPSAIPGKKKVTDGDRDSKWFGLSPIIIDLRGTYQVTHVWLVEWALVADTYTIEVSADKKQWEIFGKVQTVGNGALRGATVGNPETQVGRNDHEVLGDGHAVVRYLRVKASSDARVYLNEVEVYGIRLR